LQRFYALSDSKGDVFSSKNWLACFDDAVVVGFIRQDESLAAAAILHRAKLRFLSLVHPLPFSPHCALILEERQSNPAEKLSFRKEILSAFAEFLLSEKASLHDLSLPPYIVDTQPFIWKKFQVRPAYTYRVDLSEEPEKIAAHFAPRLRNSIRKEQGLYTVQDADTTSAFELIHSTLLRNGLRPDAAAMKAIIANSHHQGWGFGLIAKEGDQSVAAIWIIGDGNEAHYLFGGTKEGGGGPGFLLFEAIKKLRNQGYRILDLEGSMQPGIEQFFRSFGAEMTPYYRIRKASLGVELLLRLLKPELWR
jgi:hypothetical protein